jgi:Fe-S cluster assembly scaffold protein SufB
MSNKKNELERVIRVLTDNDVKIKDIYEAIELDRMDFYNIRRSTRSTKQAELAAQLKEKFKNYLNNMGAEPDSESDLTEELIQTLKRENELLRQINEERFTRLLNELEELKKRFPT